MHNENIPGSEPIPDEPTHNMPLRQLSGRGLTLETGLARELGSLLLAALRSAPPKADTIRTGWPLLPRRHRPQMPQSGSPAFARTPCHYRRPHSAIEWERFCSYADRRPVILSGPQAAFRLRAEARATRNAHKGENEMFSHIMIGSNEIARSKKFYDALSDALDAPLFVERPAGRLASSHNP